MHRSDFGLGRRSRVSVRSGNTNLREERVRISRDIRDSRGRSSLSMEEAILENRLLRPALRSDFGPGLRSSLFRRSGNTNPREETVRISRVIQDLRGCSCRTEEDIQIQNRTLRLALRCRLLKQESATTYLATMNQKIWMH